MIQWAPNPDLISVGPIHIRWYSLMFIVLFSVGYWLMQWMATRENKPQEKFETGFIYVFLGTLLGARLGHCLFYEPDYYFAHPLEIFKIWEGGLASHGGTVGVIFGLWLFAKKNPEYSFMWLLDRLSLSAALGACLIRLGNLMNSEIIGKPTEVPWAFVFERVDKIPRHPAQLYESLAYLTTFLILLFLYRRNPNRPRGFLFGVAMFGIFASRIFLEYFKENQEAFENQLFMNMGQILSIPIVGVALYLIFRKEKVEEVPLAPKKKKRK